MAEDGTPIFIDIASNQDTYTLPAEFEQHKEEHHETEPVKQEILSSGNTNATDTTEQKHPVDPNLRFKCTEMFDNIPCWYSGTTEDRLIRHIRKVHLGLNPFQCTMCDYSTYNKALFEEHVRIHQGVKPFKCRYCPYRSVSKKNTKKHERIHRPDNPLRCGECGFIGRHERSLQLHIKSHIPNIPCTQCDYKAKDAKAMREHRLMHVTSKWYKCELCDGRFAQSSSLALHEKKMKKCTECDTFLCNKLLLSKHMNTAHGAPLEGAVFTCQVCGWSAVSRPRALLHLIHHPQQTTDLDLTVLRRWGIVK